jgi:hypothetical protein
MMGTDNYRRVVNFSLPDTALEELDLLCQWQAARDGIAPRRLRSAIVRRLIRAEFLRERSRAAQEG